MSKIVRKELPVSTLDVNIENGTIWLNAPNCVLRISDLEFTNTIEDFSSIYIVDSSAFMQETPLINSEEIDINLSMFSNQITNFIFYELKHNQKIIDKEKFMERVFHNMKQFVESEYN